MCSLRRWNLLKILRTSMCQTTLYESTPLSDFVKIGGGLYNSFVMHSYGYLKLLHFLAISDYYRPHIVVNVV